MREGLIEERGRLGREHIRLEALTGALQVERHTLKEQVEAERRRLEEMRELRAREREIFLAECLEERKSISRVLILSSSFDLKNLPFVACPLRNTFILIWYSSGFFPYSWATSAQS